MNGRKYQPGEEVILYQPPLMDGEHPGWRWYTRYTIVRPTGPQHRSYIVRYRPFASANSKQIRIPAAPHICNQEEFNQAVTEYNYKKLMNLLTKDYW